MGLQITMGVSTHRLTSRAVFATLGRILRRLGFRCYPVSIRLARDYLVRGSRLTLSIVRRFDRLNTRIRLSSFNANCSSLSRLTHFPVSTVGLSRIFIQSVRGRPISRSLIQTVITITRTLGLRIVTRNMRDTGRSTFLAGGKVGRQRKFLFTGPVPTITFRH